MKSLFKRMRNHPNVLDDHVQESDPSELALDDDETLTTSTFSGQLSFSGDGDSVTNIEITDKVSYAIHYQGIQSTTSSVTFEVTSAEVIKDLHASPVIPGRSSHVEYTITLRTNFVSEKVPTSVIRRYSDFEHLQKVLKKRFSTLLSDVIFPHKLILGNFTNATIAKRSRAFEQYLSHLYSIFEIRYSNEFGDFFTENSYTHGVELFIAGKYAEAIPQFEIFLPIIEKLYGNSHPQTAQVLCALVVCHSRTERLEVAETYASLGLRCLPESFLIPPLLHTTAWLRWNLNLDKTEVMEHLKHLREQGVNVDNTKDLEDTLLQHLLSRS